jgi:hypothetical protein
MSKLKEFLCAIDASPSLSLASIWPCNQLATVVLSYRNTFPDAAITDDVVRDALLELAQECASDPARVGLLRQEHWDALRSLGILQPEVPSSLPPSMFVV